MRRTKEQAEETGRQILRAAESLFLEKSYDDVSLEEIAALAGVTRGAVYWHFTNKQGLLFALRDAVQEPFKKMAEDFSHNKDTASLEGLGDLISDMFGRLEQDPRQRALLCATMRLDITLAEKSQESSSAFHKEMRAIFVRIFQAIELNSGLSSSWTPESAASMLSATLSGLIMEWTLGKENFRLQPDGLAFIRMILTSWGIERATSWQA